MLGVHRDRSRRDRLRCCSSPDAPLPGLRLTSARRVSRLHAIGLRRVLRPRLPGDRAHPHLARRWLAARAMAVAAGRAPRRRALLPALLKVGDTTPGRRAALPNHPYNVAFAKVNEKFIGASQLVMIAEGTAYCTVGGRPAVRGRRAHAAPALLRSSPDRHAAGRLRPRGSSACSARARSRTPTRSTSLDLFARYMAERPEVGGTVTAATLLKKIFRTFHEGDPKWEILPTRNDHVASSSSCSRRTRGAAR